MDSYLGKFVTRFRPPCLADSEGIQLDETEIVPHTIMDEARPPQARTFPHVGGHHRRGGPLPHPVDGLETLPAIGGHRWPEGAPCRPSFMVIGAPKCGTTSLFEYLEAHPQVSAPARKELCFFSPFKRYLQRYRRAPSSDWDLYTSAFAGPAALQLAISNKNMGRRHTHGSAVENRSPGAVVDCEARKLQAFEACPFYLGEAYSAAVIHDVFPAMRVMAILRNPRERTISAFNDYVRMGRIRGEHASEFGMDSLVRHRIQLLQSKERTIEDHDMRILTSGVYIHGLEAWGKIWPTSQLLVLRAEDMFADTASTMARVHRFLGLDQHYSSVYGQAMNKNQGKKSRSSRALDHMLDDFFAPYNAQLYAWMEQRGERFEPWPIANVTSEVDAT